MVNPEELNGAYRCISKPANGSANKLIVGFYYWIDYTECLNYMFVEDIVNSRNIMLPKLQLFKYFRKASQYELDKIDGLE